MERNREKMRKGEYLDEEILRLQKVYKKQEKNYDLKQDPVFIRGKWQRFLPCMVLDEKVCVWLPGSFTEMSEEIARIRYPSKFRPAVLFTSAGQDENYGFHLLGKEEIGESIDLDHSIRKMQETVLCHAPESVLYGQGKIRQDRAETEGRWIEYKNFTVDEETYNLQFLIPLKSCVLAGTFNCRMAFYDEWKEPVLKSLEYICLNKEGWK